MMLHTKYQDSRPLGFRQEYFFMFFPKPMLTCTPWGVGNFWPQGYNVNKLGLKVHLMMLHSKYQGKKILSFHLENLFLACLT